MIRTYPNPNPNPNPISQITPDNKLVKTDEKDFFQ